MNPSTSMNARQVRAAVRKIEPSATCIRHVSLTGPGYCVMADRTRILACGMTAAKAWLFALKNLKDRSR